MANNTSVSLLITSGNGPAECQMAVAKTLDYLTEDATSAALDVDTNATPSKHGFLSAVVVIHGASAPKFAKTWVGTVQWRWKSTLRPGHKRANWFIGVYDLKTQPNTSHPLLEADVKFESFRAGGPGGQHQNTTDSAVRAIHQPTGLTAVAREMRSQHRNKALALDRLRLLMAAQELAKTDATKNAQNQLHAQLERGNPIRVFKGPKFAEVL